VNAEQFYHICRSAAAIANVKQVTVFGAAAIIPWIERHSPNSPWWSSLELDLDPGGEKSADLVDGSIGEGSLFEETFGIRAHGVPLEAFIAPPDWESRAAIFKDPISGISIKSPHPVDLAAAKLLRGEPRDWEFAAYCLQHLKVTVKDIDLGLQALSTSRKNYCSQAETARSQLKRQLKSSVA
jgi:hypothetical protein